MKSLNHGKDDNYCIRGDYVAREGEATLDESRESLYWDRSRLLSSLAHQYDVYKYARGIIKKNTGIRVLDIGCGPATKLMRIIYPYANEVAGIDQESAINLCKKLYVGTKAKFYVDNFTKPRMKAKDKYDIIICSDVIEHVIDPDKLLDYIKRFAEKSTIIILSTPNRDIIRGQNNLRSPKKEHIREWNFSEFHKYVQSRDFEIIKHFNVKQLKFLLQWSVMLEYIRNITKDTLRGTQLLVCTAK